MRTRVQCFCTGVRSPEVAASDTGGGSWKVSNEHENEDEPTNTAAVRTRGCVSEQEANEVAQRADRCRGPPSARMVTASLYEGSPERPGEVAFFQMQNPQ